MSLLENMWPEIYSEIRQGEKILAFLLHPLPLSIETLLTKPHTSHQSLSQPSVTVVYRRLLNFKVKLKGLAKGLR